MKLRLFFTPALLVGAVVACSGTDGSGLFAKSNSTPTEPDDSSGGDDPGSSSSSTSSSSGSSGKPSSSSSSSSGSSGSSGGKKDAGKDSAPPPPPPPTTTVACGNGPACTSGTQVCCASFGGIGNGQPTFECKPANGLIPCGAASKIACDDRTDCATGQICCGSFEENSGLGSAECKNKCTGVPGIRTGILCDPNAPVDECIASGKTCGPSSTLPGYFVCKD